MLKKLEGPTFNKISDRIIYFNINVEKGFCHTNETCSDFFSYLKTRDLKMASILVLTFTLIYHN